MTKSLRAVNCFLSKTRVVIPQDTAKPITPKLMANLQRRQYFSVVVSSSSKSRLPHDAALKARTEQPNTINVVATSANHRWTFAATNDKEIFMVSCNKLAHRYIVQQKAHQLKKYKLALMTRPPTVVLDGVETAMLLFGFIMVGNAAAQNAINNPTWWRWWRWEWE